MAYLNDFVDTVALKGYIESGHINSQVHPTLPLTILNYGHKTQIERLWNKTTMACRGLIFHTATQQIIARPFPKFFNLDEAPGITSAQLLNMQAKGVKIRVREKMDGSLGIFYKVAHAGAIHHGVATRGSFTSPQALFATEIVKKLVRQTGYDWASHQTPLVEIIYPENRIVVDYGKFSGLVLLTIALNGASHDELSPHDTRSWALRFGIPMATSYAGKDIKTLAEETRKNFEGYVVEYRDPNFGFVTRAKIKLKEYCRLHKVITGWNAKTVWELLKEGRNYEDLFDATLPEHFRKWFTAAVTALNERYVAVEKEAKSQYAFHKECVLVANANRRMLRKYYAEEFTKNEKFKGIFFNMLDNKKYSDIIWDMVRPKADETFILDADVAAEGATA